ncbi:MAG: gamma-glutamyltranspeptidase/glutathione hydrolase [Planctomycetota bacterium]
MAPTSEPGVVDYVAVSSEATAGVREHCGHARVRSVTLRGASTWACLLLVLSPSFYSCQVSSFSDEGPSAPKPSRGMVVAEHPLAVSAGLSVLEDGGNAADAAIATALALAVVYPQAGNLGGGGFAIWVPHEGAPASLDFREATPSSVTAALYLNDEGEPIKERSRTTPLAVGVPGTPAGLWQLYQEHASGELSFAELCAPAIRLATDGFFVDAWLARDLDKSSDKLMADPGSRALFFPGERALGEGVRWKQPELAQTIADYGKKGPAAFYQGRVADAIVRTLQAASQRCGTPSAGMTLEDLAGYQALWREPLIGWFRGQQVISMGPPSSGGVVLLQVLAMIDAIGLGNEPLASPRSVHVLIEALRRAFADRAEHLGDPDSYPVPIEELLAPEWLAARSISIANRADVSVGAWVKPLPPESSETTHLSVVDRDGNALSLTTTLNASFGSGILVAEAGLMLNNELDDFSIQAGTPNMYGLVGTAANQLAPGRRPLSSMTPTVVRDAGRRVSLVLGAPGGPRIITAVLQVLLRVLVLEEDIVAAVQAPRLHQQWRPIETHFEAGWDPDLLEQLTRLHAQPLKEPELKGRFGSVQGIQISSDGEPMGCSDPRRGGVAGTEGLALPDPARPEDLPPFRVPVGN